MSRGRGFPPFFWVGVEGGWGVMGGLTAVTTAAQKQSDSSPTRPVTKSPADNYQQ